MYDCFSLGELKLTPVTLQFVNRSMKMPRGLIEDVLVKVDEFYFPIDFIVLDMESTSNLTQIPIILGCPFLATANACNNCRNGAMDISFGNKRPSRDEECFNIDSMDLIQDSVEETSPFFSLRTLFTLA